MRSTLIAGLLASLPVLAVPASPQAEDERPFSEVHAEEIAAALAFLADRHDGNGDGVVTREEYSRDVVYWDRLDRNTDGKITAEDWDTEPRPLPDMPRMSLPRSGGFGPNFVLSYVYPEDQPEGAPVEPRPVSANLRKAYQDKPIVLYFVNLTAPAMPAALEELKRLHGTYGADVFFLLVYGTERHAIDGPRSPIGLGLDVPLVEHPDNEEERLALARRVQKEYGLEGMDMFLDGEWWHVTRLYGGEEGRAWLLSEPQLVLFRGKKGENGTDLRPLENQLREWLHLPPLPEPEKAGKRKPPRKDD